MRRLQYIQVGLIFLIFTLPLPSCLVLHACPSLTKYERLSKLANQRLIGIVPYKHNVKFAFSTWMDASFQRSVTKWIDENFAGREYAIRWFNQLLWSTCRKSYVYKETIVADRDNDLFEIGYLKQYMRLSSPLPEKRINDRIDGITKVNNRFKEYQVPFLVLITPSRANTLPETVPERYQSRDGISNISYDIDRLKEKLGTAGIPVLDGAEITRSLRNKLPVPAFPNTGTHWTDLAAFYTAEAVLRKLEVLGHRPLASLKYSDVQLTATPKYEDADLLNLLNLSLPNFGTYAYANISRNDGREKRQGRLVVVGSSFLFALNRIWEQAEVWKEIDFYFYFSRSIVQHPANPIPAPVDVTSIDWISTFGEADAVILEINESMLTSSHISDFLRATLKGLPKHPQFSIDQSSTQ